MSYFEYASFRRGAEQSQAVARIAITAAASAYLYLAAAVVVPPRPELWHGARISLVFLLVGVIIFAVVRLWPRPSTLRRGLVIITDIGITSYALYLTGSVGAAFYPVYLWIIVGNGLRFGVPFLYFSLVFSLGGFGAVLVLSDYWRNQLSAGVGLFIGIGVLPLFYSTLLRELHSVNRRLSEQVRHTAFSATHDPLTGLANRALFNQRLAQCTATGAASGRPVAVLYLDVDRFKQINDHYGHLVGDELLCEMGRRISQCVRDGDTVARLGGDEYCVLLLGVRGVEDAEAVARKLVEETGRPYRIADQTVIATASVGISLFPDDGTGLDALLRHADWAMYRAKHSGGNRYRYYSAGIQSISARDRETERDLRRALEEDELELYFQPRVRLDSGHIASAEALLRWRRPDIGLVLPGDFLPVAEKTDLMVPIGEWVIQRALASRAAWCAAGFSDVAMSVNVAPVQLAHHSFARFLRGALAARRPCGSCARQRACFEVEITEDSHLHGSDHIRDALALMKELGVRIAIDDFGTGYSSLQYLKTFPVDCIKVDRCFIESVHTDPRDQAVVSAIIMLAHGFDMPVVAEGVETAEQLQYLRDLGCDEAQGYYFAHPMPEPEFLARIAAQRDGATAGRRTGA
ncbi:MAG TPA: EAL domain-containing protein [Gammaproteobacteria bacterium]|nr:EAL domain-containing protein [Gammaproteobacteria bacterium]